MGIESCRGCTTEQCASWYADMDSKVNHLKHQSVVNSSGYLIYRTYHTEKFASSQTGTGQVVDTLIMAYQRPLDPRHPLPPVLV